MIMLKVRVWDRERMYDPHYEGPMEYQAKQLFTDSDGYVVFVDMKGIRYSMDPNEYMFDVFGGEK